VKPRGSERWTPITSTIVPSRAALNEDKRDQIQAPTSLIDLLIPIYTRDRLTIRTKMASERDFRLGRKRVRLMLTAKQYRAKAAEYRDLLKAARLPAETREFRKLEQSYLTLAENEEWMADNPEKTNSPGADENWYGDAIGTQQGKHPLGCQGADVATPSTAVPTKIQQLFDDAGSMGGLLQTATLRGQIARLLYKHKVDDFR
jgi:hypothetical protein